MTDQDGNTYKTVTIGTQTWMAENLRTIKYRNGDAIPEVTSNSLWGNLSTGAYCNYNNTLNSDTIATFGRLYNWYAATDSRIIAPTGWHVPSKNEWNQLINYISDNWLALIETGTKHWNSPNSRANNETGFTALPNGGRGYTGEFGRTGSSGNWWSSTEYWNSNNYISINAWFGFISAIQGTFNYQFGLSSSFKSYGITVRCIKD